MRSGKRKTRPLISRHPIARFIVLAYLYGLKGGSPDDVGGGATGRGRIVPYKEQTIGMQVKMNFDYFVEDPFPPGAKIPLEWIIVR